MKERKNTQQIGKCGELLVQYLFLKKGIESAPLTTDYGIDLIAYSKSQKRAFSVQVKTNFQPKPGGGKGKLSLGWWVPDDCPADIIALVDASRDKVWLFTIPELQEYAQQHSSERRQIYMYTERPMTKTKHKLRMESDFNRFLFDKQIKRFL